MMKQEFEQLAGYEVPDEIYDNIIEPMYMNVDVPKQEFVKMLDKNYFALPTKEECLQEMKAKALEISKACGHVTTHQEEEELMRQAREFCSRFYNAVPFLKYERATNGCSFIRSLEVYSEIHQVTVDIINLI